MGDTAEREAAIRASYGEAVFHTVVRRNVTVERAQDSHRTVFQQDPLLRSTGAQDHRDLAAEVLLRGVRHGRVDASDLTEGTRLRRMRLGLLPAAPGDLPLYAGAAG